MDPKILEAIHVPQVPILILDTIRQVHTILMLTSFAVIQLCMQNGLLSWALQLKINAGCILGEVLPTPREFACQIVQRKHS